MKEDVRDDERKLLMCERMRDLLNLTPIVGGPIDLADPIDRIIVRLLVDVGGRRMFRQEWWRIDDRARAEVVVAWRDNIRAAIAETTGSLPVLEKP